VKTATVLSLSTSPKIILGHSAIRVGSVGRPRLRACIFQHQLSVSLFGVMLQSPRYIARLSNSNIQEQAALHESIFDFRQDVLTHSRKCNGYMWVIVSVRTEISTQASQGFLSSSATTWTRHLPNTRSTSEIVVRGLEGADSNSRCPVGLACPLQQRSSCPARNLGMRC
jgi:hypothetical protein